MRNLLFMILLMVCTMSCDPIDSGDVTSVSFYEETLTVSIGFSGTLSVAILPVDANNKTVKWDSSNKDVVTVDEDSGILIAVAEGTAIITATAHNGKSASCYVTVNKISVSGISFNVTALTMEVGDKETLTVTITPATSTNKTVIWSSDNTNIASVSTSGEITAKANGTAIITASSVDDDTKVISCEVAVGPISISSSSQFIRMISSPQGLSKEYTLMNDISVSDWVPIGDRSKPFTGKFNGNNHKITINSTKESGYSSAGYFIGLFGYMGAGSEVCNLRVATNLTKTTNNRPIYLGGITGDLDGGTIYNCAVNANLKIIYRGGAINAGGITGRMSNEGIIRNCYVTGSISVSNDYDNYRCSVGGIAGLVYSATIENCHTTNSINIETSSHSYTGGIAGENAGTVQNCYATGDLDIFNIFSTWYVGSHKAGGISGNVGSTATATGIIQNCYTTSNLSISGGGATSCTVGGIISTGWGIIQNCVALNSSLSSLKATFISRIGYAGTFYNNYGSAATIPTPTKAWTAEINGKDGASCAVRPAESWWRNVGNWNTSSGASAWNFTTIWQWDSATGLPKLRNMPQI